jgi:hypothetical protein
MSELEPNRRGPRAPAFSRTNALAALAALFALALCASALATGAVSNAQSRRAPRPTATPTPTPEPSPQGESESESKPRATVKESGVVVSLILMDYDNPLMNLDYMARDDIWKEFLGRLGKSRAVSVTQADKGGRREARERAKAERESYVVLFQVEEERDSMGDASIGRVDSRTLLLRTFVYAPKTGDLKFTDTIFQRPYRDSATIGGVRVPLPTGTSRRVERYPSQRQLEQAARDAADRLMAHFSVIPPPDN